MVFFRDIGVGRHDLTPQNSTLLLRVKSVVRLDLTARSNSQATACFIFRNTLIQDAFPNRCKKKHHELHLSDHAAGGSTQGC
jgi:hypothetical protein